MLGMDETIIDPIAFGGVKELGSKKLPGRWACLKRK
jgi:hypothetical protein